MVVVHAAARRRAAQLSAAACGAPAGGELGGERSGRSFLAVGPRELTASVPRLASGAPAGEQVPGCALLVPLSLAGQSRGGSGAGAARASQPYERAAIEEADDARGPGRHRAGARARPRRGGHGLGRGLPQSPRDALRLHEEIGRAQRSRGRLSCVIVDLDDFKLVNDRLRPSGRRLDPAPGRSGVDGRVPGLRPGRALWRRRVRRDPAQRRHRQRRGGRRARARARARRWPVPDGSRGCRLRWEWPNGARR